MSLNVATDHGGAGGQVSVAGGQVSMAGAPVGIGAT